MDEIITRTLDVPGITPLRAYAALRAKAANRTSFFLEMTEAGEDGARQSVIGFLAKREAAHPPAMDPLKDLATRASETPPPSDDAFIGASCVNDMLVVLLFEAVLPRHGIAPWPDQVFVGREIHDVTSIVFDHASGKFTIVATNVNVADRVLRVITEAPLMPEQPKGGGDKPLYLFEQPPDAAFAKLYHRATRRLALGGIDKLLLGRTFCAPARGADPFEVFCALRESAPLRHLFFVECAQSPMFGKFVAMGAAHKSIRFSAQTGPEALAKEIHERFPIEENCGGPAKESLAAVRDIGSGPLGLRGGGIARVRPGGILEMLWPDVTVTFENEQYLMHGVAQIEAARDAKAHSEATEQTVAAAFAAIRRAHDAALARETSEEAREAEAAKTSD